VSYPNDFSIWKTNPSYRKRPKIPLAPVLIKPYKKRIKILPSDQRFEINAHINSLAGTTRSAGSRLISATTYTKRGHGRSTSWFSIKLGRRKHKSFERINALIDYPLNGKYVISIPPTLGYHQKPIVMNIGHFLWHVAKVYKDEIYTHQKKYGVWGHGINDLVFEVVILKRFKTKTYGIVEIGS